MVELPRREAFEAVGAAGVHRLDGSVVDGSVAEDAGGLVDDEVGDADGEGEGAQALRAREQDVGIGGFSAAGR